MLRRPPSIELFTLDADSTKVVNSVLYIKSMPPITPDNVISCNLLCPDTGAKRQVTITPTIAEGCDCPFTWELTAETLPDLSDAGTNNTFDRPLFYNYEAPNGAVPSAATLVNDLVAQINADPNAPFVASNVANTLRLLGKANGHTWNVYAPSGTIVVDVAGTSDVLSDTIIRKMFPILPGTFGQTPAAINQWCSCHCLLKVKVQFCCEGDLPSDAYDVDMDRALLGHEYEFVLTVPCIFNEVDGEAEPTTPANWEEPYKALAEFFTCLVEAE